MQPQFEDVIISFNGVEIGRASSIKFNKLNFTNEQEERPKIEGYKFPSKISGTIRMNAKLSKESMRALLGDDYKQKRKAHKRYFRCCKVYRRTKSWRIKKKMAKEIMSFMRRYYGVND